MSGTICCPIPLLKLAVEHVLQECGVPRADVFVQPAGRENTLGTVLQGRDAKVASQKVTRSSKV